MGKLLQQLQYNASTCHSLVRGGLNFICGFYHCAQFFKDPQSEPTFIKVTFCNIGYFQLSQLLILNGSILKRRRTIIYQHHTLHHRCLDSYFLYHWNASKLRSRLRGIQTKIQIEFSQQTLHPTDNCVQNLPRLVHFPFPKLKIWHIVNPNIFINILNVFVGEFAI